MPETEDSPSTESQTPPTPSSTLPVAPPSGVSTTSSVTVTQSATPAQSAGNPGPLTRLFANISGSFVLYAEVLILAYLIVSAVSFHNALAQGWTEQVALVIMAHQASPTKSGTVVVPPLQ